MNCIIHDSNKGFPKNTEMADMIFLKDIDSVPQDIINYMNISPDCTRETGVWRWCAPNEICRHKTEPGFMFASKYLGMGHQEMLAWFPKTGHWDIVHIGGANGWEQEDSHNIWLQHNSISEHKLKTISAWMNEFSKSD